MKNPDDIIQMLRGYADDCNDSEACYQCTIAWMCEKLDGCAPKIIADTIEQLQFPHWIPVSERLPEELGHYLAVVKRIAPDEFGGNGTRIRIMRWLGDDWRYAYHIPEWINQKITETVTHWMPLPAAPKEEK